ncbi:hypothetical protein PHYSODRAFT_341944 [Phytophthora sojae]|uniref:Cas12f1-like TNB domain-containing protein n=1 Tax=Phytophthora sojae (strain P6497) TaxID=1094619 RepID=G5AEV4_PHYSP|nr:hypothetical protein PHYSODRAFT_341944 [Phytophthora sojae]EGZ05744.1 hypothetical protein PHYSODRAFT_341944 [Phytophthora sojae]|eukprot:XP_009538605.1 hypothetical protein PHYSODRAFT_341944 [Phytophthora sojae]
MTAVLASRTQFFRMKNEGKKTTFPVLGFRSERARSNSIGIRTKTEGFELVDDGGKHYVQFHSKFFGASLGKGIRLSHAVPTPEHMARLIRVRGGKYYFAFSTHKEFEQSAGTRVGGMDPGVRKYLKRRYEVIDARKSRLAKLDNAAKAAAKDRESTKLHTDQKVANAKTVKPPKSREHRRRARLRREIQQTNTKITNAVIDFHHKFASWIAATFKTFLLPSFQTSLMVRKYEVEMAADGTPEKRRICSPTARRMLGLRHYSFSQILKHKMERAGGRLISCDCGKIKENLGGKEVYKCDFCGAVMDLDLNGAKNIIAHEPASYAE